MRSTAMQVLLLACFIFSQNDFITADATEATEVAHDASLGISPQMRTQMGEAAGTQTTSVATKEKIAVADKADIESPLDAASDLPKKVLGEASLSESAASYFSTSVHKAGFIKKVNEKIIRMKSHKTYRLISQAACAAKCAAVATCDAISYRHLGQSCNTYVKPVYGVGANTFSYYSKNPAGSPPPPSTGLAMRVDLVSKPLANCVPNAKTNPNCKGNLCGAPLDNPKCVYCPPERPWPYTFYFKDLRSKLRNKLRCVTTKTVAALRGAYGTPNALCSPLLQQANPDEYHCLKRGTDTTLIMNVDAKGNFRKPHYWVHCAYFKHVHCKKIVVGAEETTTLEHSAEVEASADLAKQLLQLGEASTKGKSLYQLTVVAKKRKDLKVAQKAICSAWASKGMCSDSAIKKNCPSTCAATSSSRTTTRKTKIVCGVEKVVQFVKVDFKGCNACSPSRTITDLKAAAAVPRLNAYIKQGGLCGAVAATV